MDSHRYRYFIFITAGYIIGGASSYYNETYMYNGQIFILPEIEEIIPLELTLIKAQEWCTNNLSGSTLPRIIEDGESIGLFQFIEKALLAKRLNNEQTVLVNSIRHARGDWSWINGHDVKGINVKIPGWRGEKSKNPHHYGYLSTGREYNIHASRPRELRPYICEYANASICVVEINQKCYQRKIVEATWFQARNNCTTNGGDLASFESLDDSTLKDSLQNISPDDRNGSYWIGIQRNLQHLDDKGSEIKFINWTNSHRSDINASCLCLNVTKKLSWIECDCEEAYPFICTNTTQLTSDQSPPPYNANIVIGAVVSCVVIVVIIVIVIVVVIIRRKQRNRPVKTYMYEANTKTTTDERNIYSEIQEPSLEDQTITSCSASNATYAAIQPTPETNDEFQANNIVYAELDLPPKA